MNRTVIKTLALAVVSGALLGACTTPGQSRLASVPQPEGVFQVPDSSADRPAFNSGKTVARWWESLENPQLSDLVETALDHNNDIGVALANVAVARSLLDLQSLDRLPAIGTGLEAADQRLAQVASFPGQPQRFTTYNASFDASWELDLFGRVSQRINATQADLAVTEAELDGAYVTVAAEVARTYMQLRGVQYRLNVNQRNADTQQQSYQLTRELAAGGLGDALDEQRSLAQWELVRSRLPGLEAQIDILINRLGVLTGQMPGSLRQKLIVPQPLPDLPVSVALGDPLQMLQRRPDIRRSEQQLAASLARYQLSVAELYPAARFSGSLGFLATHLADLGTGGTLTHLLAPQFSWQAFNMGRVRAQIDASDARVEGQLQQFEKTVLTAFEEVDNSLTAISHESERRARLFAAAEASAQAAGFARERFESGTDSYLDVLDAQRTQLEAEDQLVLSEVELALQLISLYKALGGGWELQH